MHSEISAAETFPPQHPGPDAAVVDVIGTPCLTVSKEALLSWIEHEARRGPALSIDFTNVHITVLRRTDKTFHRDTASVDYFVPDSQVLKWAVNWLGGNMKQRVYGPEFLSCAIAAAAPATRHFFLGGSRECVEKLVASIREKNPAFLITGHHDGYFRADQEEEVLHKILEARPDLIWVGLGTPRQQNWIHRFKDRFPRGVLLAVGFAFDVNAGTKSDAPAWMQRYGLTWLFRLLSEPRRLFWRYLKYNSLFVLLLLRQKLFRGRGKTEKHGSGGGPA